jgi:hypothetical protein
MLRCCVDFHGLIGQHAAMNDSAHSFRHSGHETFACRFAWLTKAATAVSADPDILTARREDDAMSELGVGKNMVRSIRFWAESVGILQSCEHGHVVTEFGKKLFVESSFGDGKHAQGLDPYLEDIQTLWIIHWRLATNKESLIFAWDFLLNRFQEPELHSASVLRAFGSALIDSNISKGSMEQLWNVFLHSYVPTRGRKGEVREDSLDCPLVELNLLIPSGFVESATHAAHPEPKFAFRRESKPEIGGGLFAYCLGEFWQNHHQQEKSIPLHLVANGHGSPGQIFKLPEDDIRTRLLGIDNASNGLFVFDDSAAIPRVRRTGELPIPLELVYE